MNDGRTLHYFVADAPLSFTQSLDPSADPPHPFCISSNTAMSATSSICGPQPPAPSADPPRFTYCCRCNPLPRPARPPKNSHTCARCGHAMDVCISCVAIVYIKLWNCWACGAANLLSDETCHSGDEDEWWHCGYRRDSACVVTGGSYRPQKR